MKTSRTVGSSNIIKSDGHNSAEIKSPLVADLPLLCKIIFSNKIIYGIFGIVTISMSFAYSMFIPPVYKAEIIFSQPDTSQYRNLLSITGDHFTIRPTAVFFDFKKSLASRAHQYSFLTLNSKKYFSENYNFIFKGLEHNDVDAGTGQFRSKKLSWLVGQMNDQWIPFLPSPHILKIETYSDVPDRFEFNLSVEWTNADVARDLAQDFALHVQKIVANLWIEETRYSLQDERNIVERQIIQRRDYLRESREIQIAQLEQSARIAETLGYIDPIPSGTHRIELMPLYYRGSKALKGQANILREHTNNEPLTNELYPLQQELAALRQTLAELPTIENDLFSAVAASIDVATYLRKDTISTNRLFLLLIPLIVGICVAALFNIFLYYIKERPSR